MDIGTRSASWHSAMSTPRNSSHWREKLLKCGKFKKTSVSAYFCQTKAGVGSYSQVVAAVDTATGQEVALKVFRPWSPYGDVSQISSQIEVARVGMTPVEFPDIVETLVKEALFIQRAKEHPNIIKLHAICIDSPTFVMEKAMCDLYNLIAKNGRNIPMEAVYKWTGQIASGLDCIHKAGMVHLDIKTSNILVSKDLNAIICDFGNTANCPPGGSFTPEKEIVTLWYRAPEVIMGSHLVDQKVDMWSFGAVILELLTSAPAFQGDDSQRNPSNVNFNNDQLEKIFQVVGTPDLDNYKHCYLHYLFSNRHTRHPSVLHNIVTGAIERKQSMSTPGERPDMWVGVVNSMLEISPSSRMSSAEAAKRFASASRLSFEIKGVGRCCAGKVRGGKGGLLARLPFASCTNSLNIAQ